MKRYTEYKDSGVEYLGEIPSNWKALRIKFVSQINPNKDDSINKDSEELVTFLPMECVNADGSISTIQKKPIKSLCTGFTFFRKDDIIFAKITPCFENGKGALLTELETEFGFGSTEFHVLRALPDICNNEFLYFYTRSPLFRDIGEAFMSGSAGQKRVPTDFIENFYISIASLKEQKQIASYLGNKTSQIDSLISKKKQMIDLLKEERAAIINHAVTKGINPDAEMKDSGVKWLGEVPKHWEVAKLKHIVENHDFARRPLSGEERGKITNKLYDYYGASGVIDQVDNYLFDGEYILIGEDGANLLTRNTALAFKVTGKFWVNNHAHILKPKDRNNIDYFTYLFECADYKTVVSGSAQPKLTQEALGDLYFVVPPIPEQNAITGFLKIKISKIDSSITHIEKEISLIEEYRTALINETVTGKIDVRGLV